MLIFKVKAEIHFGIEGGKKKLKMGFNEKKFIIRNVEKVYFGRGISLRSPMVGIKSVRPS